MTGIIGPPGLWSDIRTRPADAAKSRPALFLDRDGTLIEHVHYLRQADDVRLIPDAVEAVRAAHDAGWAVVIVTNQSAVGRGYFGWDAVEAVQDRMYQLLAEAGAAVDASYACGDAPADAGGPPQSAFRKPAPGMLLRAREDLVLDLSRSVIAGDGAHDLAAGKAAGLRRGILVPTGYGVGADEQAKARTLADVDFAVSIGSLAGLAPSVSQRSEPETSPDDLAKR